jgi:hypothetical protein
MKTISIEWSHVARITSPQLFTVDTDAGARLFGSFDEPTEPGSLAVRTEQGIKTLAFRSVMGIQQAEADIWGGFRGSIDVGVELAKANRKKDYRAEFSADYFGYKVWSRVSATSSFSKQEGAESKTRNDLSGQIYRYLKPRWFYGGLGHFQQNAELNLDRRVDLCGSFGRHVVYRRGVRLSALGGALVSREKFKDEPAVTQAGALGLLDLSAYRYDFPEAALRTTLVVIPSLTEPGRVRAELNASLSFEVFKDFSIGLSLFGTRDTTTVARPVDQSDYGLSMTIGYKF